MNKIPLVADFFCLLTVAALLAATGCMRVQAPDDAPLFEDELDETSAAPADKAETQPKPAEKPAKIEPCPGTDGLQEYPAAKNNFPRITKHTGTWRPWTAGHPIVMAGKRLWVLDRDNRTLVQVRRDGLALADTVTLDGTPDRLVVGPNKRLFASVFSSGQVVRLDDADGEATVTAKWTLGRRVRGLALDATGRVGLTVVLATGKLVAFHADSGAILAQMSVGSHARAIGVNATGLVTVARVTGDLHTYRLAIGAKGDSATLAANATGAVPLGGTRLLPGADVVKVHNVFSTVLAKADVTMPDSPFEVATRALGVDIDPATGVARVAHVMAHPGTPKDSAMAAMTAKTGGGYGGGAMSSTGKWFDVPRPHEPALTQVASDGKRIDTPNAHKPIVGGSAGTASWAAKVAPKGEKGWHRFGGRIVQPRDVVHHPTHNLLFVVGEGSDNVLALHTQPSGGVRAFKPGALVPVAELTTAANPIGIAISADGETAYTLNRGDLTVSTLDLRPLLTAVPPHAAESAARKLPVQVCRGETRPYAFAPLTPDQLAGRRFFTTAHRSHPLITGHAIACASCHLDGGEDHLTWFVRGGPRQTPILRGRVQGSAPFNWKGSHMMAADNMDETFERLGVPKPTAAAVNQVLAWLQTTDAAELASPHLSKDGLTKQQLAGKAIFEDPKVGCGGCHFGADNNDGGLHNVGTVSDTELALNKLHKVLPKSAVSGSVQHFNTPNLSGLWRSAPYLHDGSAATLHAVFERTGDQMGKVSHLTPTELDALVAYLLTL